MMYVASAIKGLIPAKSTQSIKWNEGGFASLPVSDEELVLRAQSGERSAFDSLIRKYRDRLLKICRRYVRNEDDAQDAVQVTLLRAYRGLRSFRGDAAFYSWLHRIAINTAVSALVIRRREEALFLAGDVHENSAAPLADPKCLETPEEIALANEIGDVVTRAIGSLCEEQRAAIILHELEGMNYAEVANAMACPLGTVRSRVSRARDAIDTQLRGVYDRGLGRSKVNTRAHSTSADWGAPSQVSRGRGMRRHLAQDVELA